MRIVIDRLSKDEYGDRFYWIIGAEVIINEMFEPSTINHGYLKGYYGQKGIINGFCSSFTCVCIDDNGIPL